VIAVVLMRGDVLRGVFCAAGKRSAFGSARRNAANPRVGSRRQRLRPARKEIRRGGEKPRGRSVIRCMAAPDRRRCLQRWRSSGNRGSARLRPSRRGLQWSVGASRQAGGVVDGGVVPPAHREVWNGRKPQERKVSTAFARSTGPGTKRGLGRGARGEEGRCRRATARRYFNSGAKRKTSRTRRIGSGNQPRHHRQGRGGSGQRPTSPLRSAPRVADCRVSAGQSYDLIVRCQPHESGPRGHAACTEKL
jgi:hypothetical protein